MKNIPSACNDRSAVNKSCYIMCLKYLVRFCKDPEQKADDSRVKHGVSVETQPGKIHADLHSEVVTDIIYEEWWNSYISIRTIRSAVYSPFQNKTGAFLPRGCLSHTAWTQEVISWLRILCSWRGNICWITPRATSSGTTENTKWFKYKFVQRTDAVLQKCNRWQRTDRLSFQEVNVVKHLPMFGSQIVQPILYNALTLLKPSTVMERRYKSNMYLFNPQNKSYKNRTAHSSSDLWGKKAELALYVLIDVAFLAAVTPHPAAKLRFDSLVHAHLLCSTQ